MESNLHVCHQCSTPQLFNSARSFSTHCKSHIENRTTNNFTILTNHLFNQSTKAIHNNNWEHGLNWLRNHDQEPPSFPTNLLPSIKYQLEDMLLDLLEDIVKATNEMKKPGKGHLASQFACQRSDSSSEYQDRHLIYYAATVLTAVRNCRSVDESLWRRTAVFRKDIDAS